MANSTKKSKTGKKSKAKLGLGIIVAVMILFVAGYFVYFSGIVPQLLPGMTITETKDGQNVKIAELSVLETNYYYMSIYSMYAQYGMISQDSIDTVFNSTTGQTYREYLLTQGAQEAMNNIILEREADAKGFRQLSQADKAAKEELESLRGMAKLYGYPTLDRYIAAQYGTGMTSRLYRKCMARGLYGEEYIQYISQFDPSIVPTDESINEKYKADPSAYEHADFNYYLVKAETKDGKTDIAAAKKDAQWIADKSTDAKSFRSTVMTYLKGKGDTEALKEYENDADPTAVSDMSKSSVEQYYDANLAAFLFAEGRRLETRQSLRLQQALMSLSSTARSSMKRRVLLIELLLLIMIPLMVRQEPTSRSLPMQMLSLRRQSSLLPQAWLPSISTSSLRTTQRFRTR